MVSLKVVSFHSCCSYHLFHVKYHRNCVYYAVVRCLNSLVLEYNSDKSLYRLISQSHWSDASPAFSELILVSQTIAFFSTSFYLCNSFVLLLKLISFIILLIQVYFLVFLFTVCFQSTKQFPLLYIPGPCTIL